MPEKSPDGTIDVGETFSSLSCACRYGYSASLEKVIEDHLLLPRCCYDFVREGGGEGKGARGEKEANTRPS